MTQTVPPPRLSRAQRRMLRLLGAGWILVVGRHETESGIVRSVWMYTLAGKTKRSTMPVIAQMKDLEMIVKKRGFGECQQFELTELGRDRAAKLLRRVTNG